MEQCVVVFANYKLLFAKLVVYVFVIFGLLLKIDLPQFFLSFFLLK